MKRTRLFLLEILAPILPQNGRVSKVVAAAAGVLGISVFGTASEEETLELLQNAEEEKKGSGRISLSESCETGFRKGKIPGSSHVDNLSLQKNRKL